MDILLNPNIAYLFLAGGLVFSVLSLMAPGTGILEIISLFTLILAAYGVSNLPINGWALLILFIGVALFVASIRWHANIILLVLSICALILGSVYLFRSPIWWQPAVNPFLAAVVSIFSGAFFWFAAKKIIEARSLRPTHDLQTLIGAIGEARSDVHDGGSVQVGGELWSARSQEPIPNGSRVRVTGRDGFILEVEAEKPSGA
jgi:membrane-bound serine protease (ClpP class)